MEILDIQINKESNEKTFLFEDDTSVTVDLTTKEVSDCDGFGVVPKSRLDTISKVLGYTVIY